MIASTGNPVGDSLIRLGRSAQAAGLPHLVIGGNAVIHYGVPRFTRDVDLLVPEDAAEAWRQLLRECGYECFHAADAFLQFEASQREPLLAPVDLMMVDASTWEKMSGAAEAEVLSPHYTARWPSPLHLVALKLHAWRGVFRLSKAQDWSDIVELIRRCRIDLEDDQVAAVLKRYGGTEALEQLMKQKPPPQPE